MLPINFHKTFVPERHLIGALLHYAALGKQGDYQQISAETGIPMGQSTGKVPAIFWTMPGGMGLIELAGETNSAVKKPVLTPLGRVVYSDDRYLGEKLTQWIVHMNLCGEFSGACAWRSAFADGRRVLGARFTETQLESHLRGIYGSGNNRTGPLIRAYKDDAALGRAGVLIATGDTVERRKAPILDAYATAYSAVILALMDAHFPAQTQVAFSDFEKTLWFDICLWNEGDVEQVCALLDRKGFVTIDRQMRPWLLDRRTTTESVWSGIFDDLA